MALLHEDLVLFDVEAKSSEELLKKLANVLLEKGYVKNSYPEAILTREAAYPTGLNTKGIAIAMPHAAAEHAVQAAILVARLKEPVILRRWGAVGKMCLRVWYLCFPLTIPKVTLLCLGNLCPYSVMRKN